MKSTRILLRFVAATASLVLPVACTKPPVNWGVAQYPLAYSASTQNPTVGLLSTYSIQGGVTPYNVTLSGLGSFQMQDAQTILFQRPWQAGSSRLSITDFLGTTLSVPLTLSGGAIQLGGGADPLANPLRFSQDASGNLYVLGSTQAVMPATQYGTPGNQYVYVAKIAPSGFVGWIAELGAGTFSTATGLQISVDSSGNCYFLGSTDGLLPAVSVGGAHGILDAYIGKLDPSGNLLWLTQLGGGGGSTTNPTLFVLNPDGTTNLAGVTTGSLGGTQTGTHGANDTFVAKLSASGALSWANQLGGGGASSTLLVRMVQDAGANLVVLGTADSNLGGTQSGVRGSVDAYVAKFTSAGAFSWVNQLGAGGGATVSPVAIGLDSGPNADLLAITTGTGATQVGTNGSQDTLIAQVSPTGVLNWWKQIGGGGAANVLPVSEAIDSGGNILYAGTTDSDLTAGGLAIGAVQSGTRGPNDTFFGKLTSAGAVSWVRELGGGNITTPSQIMTDAGNNVYLAGTLNGNLGATRIGSSGIQDAFVARFTSAGALSWADQVGGSGLSSTSFSQLLIDSGGNVFFAGQTSGLLGGTQSGAHGNLDAFLMKTGSNGALAWLNQIGAGGSSQTSTVQLTQDAAGNTYLLGKALRLLVGSLVGPSNFQNSFIIKVNSSGQLQ